MLRNDDIQINHAQVATASTNKTNIDTSPIQAFWERTPAEEKEPHLHKLKQLIQEGQLKLYYELSLPRSHSTAWQIAICEAPEIHAQINEPGHHADLKSRRFDEPRTTSDRTSDDYFKRIWERVVAKENRLLSTNARPVGLVVNDLVQTINRRELMAMLTLTDKIIITIRDPRLQACSALLRTINDALDSPGGGNISLNLALQLAKKTTFTQDEMNHLVGNGRDKINAKHILQALSQPEDAILTSDLLIQAIQNAIERCKIEYIDICWENLQTQCQVINEFSQKDSDIVMIDGSDLLENPSALMQQTSNQLKLTYSPDMVNNWKKANKENFHCSITENWGELAFTNHWNGPVRASTQFEAKKDSVSHKMAVEDFPETLQESIHKAVTIYESLAAKNVSQHIASLKK